MMMGLCRWLRASSLARLPSHGVDAAPVHIVPMAPPEWWPSPGGYQPRVVPGAVPPSVLPVGGTSVQSPTGDAKQAAAIARLEARLDEVARAVIDLQAQLRAVSPGNFW
jgi:hypothetical protein